MWNLGAIWLLHIHVLWYTKICDAWPPFFSFSAFVRVFFCLFSGAVRVAFLSPVSRLSPETNTSSSPLMKPVFRIENSPTRTRDNIKKKDKNANNATSVAWRYCFSEGLRISTRLKSLQLFVLMLYPTYLQTLVFGTFEKPILALGKVNEWKMMQMAKLGHPVDSFCSA